MCYRETCYQYETIDRQDSATKFTPAAEGSSLMRRRALLATAAAASTASLAGCSVPPWGEIPETADGAEVTFRTKHTGEFESDEPSPYDDAVLLRALDADPPRLTVRGRLLAG